MNGLVAGFDNRLPAKTVMQGEILMSKCLNAAFMSCILGVTVCAGSVSAAPLVFKSWEVASQFDDTANPSGIWKYGYETSLNVGFGPLATQSSFGGGVILGWMRDNDPAHLPGIAHNVTYMVEGPFGGAFVIYPSRAMSMHPGVNCELADLRFAVPKKGKYKISGRFYAMDYNLGTTTDVHVSVNGATAFNGMIDYNAGLRDASFTVTPLGTLLAGDLIDFQVGCGSNGNYFSDTTGLNAVIERK
jgi:hypothetical protein